MAIKSFRPKTPSLRFKTVLDYKQELSPVDPYKPLMESKNRIDGRNLTRNERPSGPRVQLSAIDGSMRPSSPVRASPSNDRSWLTCRSPMFGLVDADCP